MKTPKILIEVVDRAISLSSDIEDQAMEALRMVKGLEGFEALRDYLWQEAVRELVYQRRCVVNQTTKSGTKSVMFVGGARVGRGGSEEGRLVIRSVYESLYFAGKAVGDMTTEDIDKTAESEAKIAAGHRANVWFLQRLRPHVKEGSTVRDSVDRKTLNRLVKSLQKRKEADRTQKVS